MKFSTPIVLAAAASLATAADSLSSSWTWTRTITNNDMTYTKEGTELYTGQATTEPTSGTVTTTIGFTNEKGESTRFKTMTNTYGQATTITTNQVVSGPDETYTRPLVQAMHTSEVSSFLSSHSSMMSAASEADEFTSKHGTMAAKTHAKFSGSSFATESGSSTAASSGSSSSDGAGNALQYGAGLGAFGAAAALLL